MTTPPPLTQELIDREPWIDGHREQVTALLMRAEKAEAELDDMRRAWAILDEPGAELRHAHTATEAAQQFVARLAEARATSQLHAEAAARALARESVLREALAEADGTHWHAGDCVQRMAPPSTLARLDHCPDCNADLAKQRRINAALASPDTAAKRRENQARLYTEEAERLVWTEELASQADYHTPDEQTPLDAVMGALAKVRAAALDGLEDLAIAVMAEHDEETTGSNSLDSLLNGVLAAATKARLPGTPAPALRALAATRHEATQDHDGGCVCDDCRRAIQAAAKESGF